MFDFNMEKLSKWLEYLSIDYDHNMIDKFISYLNFKSPLPHRRQEDIFSIGIKFCINF